MLVLGIILGLVAAVAQSASYVFSRMFVIRRGQAVLRLMVLGHLIMGIASAALLPFFWSPAAKAAVLAPDILWPLLGSAGFYMLGQACIFLALRHSDASRISPMLGLKIAILGVIYTLFCQTPWLRGSPALVPMQWVAIVISVGAAFVLNTSAARLPARLLLAVLAGCLMYCLSDISIYKLVSGLKGVGRLDSTMLTVCLTYAACGVVALFGLPFIRRKHGWGDWLYALPFSASWFGAMIALYTCFGLINVVFGNVIQSTRGLISVLVGAQLAGFGMVHLEQVTPRSVFVRKLLAAAMMTAAITIFAIYAKRSG
jgi:drug/metabolite transporter (DMT)-like permease